MRAGQFCVLVVIVFGAFLSRSGSSRNEHGENPSDQSDRDSTAEGLA